MSLPPAVAITMILIILTLIVYGVYLVERKINGSGSTFWKNRKSNSKPPPLLEPFVNPNTSLIEKILTAVVMIASAILAYAFQAEAFIIFACLIVIGIGVTLGKKLAQKFGNTGWFKLIAWSNVLTWNLPVAGIITGSLTLGASRAVERKKYVILGLIGLILSALGWLAGIYLYSA